MLIIYINIIYTLSQSRIYQFTLPDSWPPKLMTQFFSHYAIKLTADVKQTTQKRLTKLHYFIG